MLELSPPPRLPAPEQFSEINIKDLEDFSMFTAVFDEISAKQALSKALQSRKLKNQAEESRDEIVRPVLDYQKAVNKLVKDLRGKFEAIEQRLICKITAWMALETKENIFFDLNKIEVEDGTITKKKQWDYEIFDEAKLPREYLSPNHSLIKDAIKLGLRTIPGVVITENEEFQLRVKN